MRPDSLINGFVRAFMQDQGIQARDVRFSSLAGDGSTRLFRRTTPFGGGPTFIVMENAPRNNNLKKENFSFLMIGKHLFHKGLPVPEIYRFDLKNGWFILEDMGNRSFQDEASSKKDRIVLYEKVLEVLFRLQIEGSQGFNPEWCYQTERYDRNVMRRYEAEYFRDSFLCNYLGIKGELFALERSFDHLATMASKAENHHFLHRDFQSRNIMISGGKIGILDWQGGRLGPLPYDLASLIIDPYMDLSSWEKDQVFQIYLQLLKDYQSKWVNTFKRYFPYLAILRNLQILGAFSYLSKVKGKTYFESYLSPALRSLHSLLNELKDPKMSPLINIVRSLPDLSKT